jgi:hypothetical protein
MSEDLTQAEAEYLLALNKRAVSADVFWPIPGENLSVDLVSLDESEKFLLDVYRGRIKLSKLRLQHRARTTIILVRLEIDGAPHRNPDDVELPCPHIHLYREGYGDKWAYPVPTEHFSDLADRHQTLQDFMRFCNIVQPPTFHVGLLP